MVFVGHLGLIGKMCFGVVRVLFRRPLEIRSTLYQLEALGVRSLGIASVVALFTGLVMAVQKPDPLPVGEGWRSAHPDGHRSPC